MDDAWWTIVVAALAGINCALVGTYLVLRKTAMMGDAIAHSMLPGIVLALLATGTKYAPVLFLGASLTGLLVSFLVAFLEKNIHIQTDAAIGINFTFLFALGVVLISFFSRKIDLDPECSLYGELATVPLDVYKTAGGIHLGPKSFYLLLTALVLNLSFIILGYKQLFATTFDPEFAQSIGIHTKGWHYALMTVTALTTVATFEVAGAILVVALLIVPSASMYLITKCLKRLLLYNVFFAFATAIGGYYISLFFNSSMAATMVTLAGLLFFMTFVFAKFKNK
ncbi:MAG TPA: metal ABC transporter permease [Amoebophilaceae bacterium]|jgi:manganese/zinc/iron transport system permease protein|nr:metal ABC transporter permease [Amoebophilaceae bacterium]